MKTALVTGGSRGIGAEIVRALAAEGFFVVINCVRGIDDAKKVLADVENAGGKGVVVPADVGKYDEIQRLFDAIEKDYGGVDVLVNNAGIEIRRSSLDYEEEIYDLMANVNLKGAFFCSQRALRTMTKKGWGRVVNISSAHEQRPTGNRSVYSITKAGLWMMTREHAREFGKFGVTVNSVAPGAIRTDLNRKVLEDTAYEARVLQNIPAGFIGEPSDVSGLVVFLTTDAARYVNGAALYADGGLSLC